MDWRAQTTARHLLNGAKKNSYPRGPGIGTSIQIFVLVFFKVSWGGGSSRASTLIRLCQLSTVV